jgi:hypothetical protein
LSRSSSHDSAENTVVAKHLEQPGLLGLLQSSLELGVGEDLVADEFDLRDLDLAALLDGVDHLALVGGDLVDPECDLRRPVPVLVVELFDGGLDPFELGHS